nr:tetratricopeptide repeat protein 33 [Pogona vitticeps]XP_020639297.1 tetratricopeptide repeat protein 33 [Pogona vitticeps]XP_020639298.1 tetratricopeptide repeat protein 33 [Pogona vitticeps]XP_020639299.1 tetratricopeptide repeat protein 33 [Pogona vitticeps]XP_020639300.1 tetratricopeptide repeat protein 33 [Pogona vitticeps]
MASFGWKRKIGEKVSKATSQQFEAQAADEQGLVDDDDDVDWVHEAKRKKGLLLEECLAKSKCLKEEGAALAENERYRKAVQKWDEALQLTPEDATLYEMKSQVLMSLHEIFPAVHAAEMAVQRDPRSWEAWQTLGRAQLGLGEITLAIRSFQIALHICPLSSELWNEDLSWARKLQQQQKKASRAEPGMQTTASQGQSSEEPIPDYDFESEEILTVCAAIAEKEKASLASKSVVIVSASGTVETVTEKEKCTTTPDSAVFIKAR